MAQTASPDTAGANYPFNHWWVAATSEEVGRASVLSRRLLGRFVALYRRTDSVAVALADRCPHRGTPLSRGTLDGNDVVCSYHGFRFGSDGRCVHIPTQSSIPSSANVTVYPVVEKPPYLWIWLGDPDRADVTLVPDLPFMTDPDWVVARGLMHLDVNFMNLKENVLDLTHLAFVHASSFGMRDYVEPPQPTIEGDAVGFTQRFLDTPLPAFYGEPCGIGTERPVDRIDTGMSISPALHLSTVEIINKLPAAGERDRYWVRFCHITTPSGPVGTHYFWVLARDHGAFDGAVEELCTLVERAFDEDKVILEAIEARNALSPLVAEMSVAADRPALLCRQQLRKSLERDATQAAG
jgi:vanillate O-demethylase monooxygenase subunit